MNEYELIHSSLLRFLTVLGMVTAMALYERRHLTVGSTVVPGYIAASILEPYRIAFMVATAWLAYAVVHLWLPKLTVVSARGKYFLAVNFSAIFAAIAWRSALLPGGADVLVGVGYVLPGLLAHDMGRQGVRKTLAAAAAACLPVSAVVLLLAWVFPQSLAGQSPSRLPALEALLPWLPVMLMLSTMASAALRHHSRQRCGGFVGAAYLTLLLANPAQLVLWAVLTALTCVVADRLLRSRLILFGRRRFTAILAVGMILCWLAQTVLEWIGVFGPLASSSPALAVIGVMLVGLFANDIKQAGLADAAKGTVLASLFCLSTTALLMELRGPARPEAAVPLAVLTAAVAAWVFGPYFAVGLNRCARRTSGAAVRVRPAHAMRPAAQALLGDGLRVAGLLMLLAAAAVVFGWCPWGSQDSAYLAAEPQVSARSGPDGRPVAYPGPLLPDAGRLGAESAAAPPGRDGGPG